MHISISLPVAFDAQPSERPPEDRTALKGQPQDIAETLRAFAEAGVHEAVLTPSGWDKAAHAAMLGRIAETVRPLLGR